MPRGRCGLLPRARRGTGAPGLACPRRPRPDSL